MAEKSRHIPLGEFLDVLSKEYMVAFVRSKTYTTVGNRKHWAKVCQRKREKIEDISNRNNFPNIFNNKPTYIKYLEMRNEDNLPLFLMNVEDMNNYYGAIGEEVVVTVDGTPAIGKIASYSEELQQCGVLVSDSTLSFDIRDLRRFL